MNPPVRLTRQRNVAQQCQAQLTFHRPDGTDVLGRPLTARWSASPEPVPIPGQVEGGPRILILDPGRLVLDSRTEIVPGEGLQGFSVTARFDGESEAYGWSNENYFSAPLWRDSNWKLLPGVYLIEVSVRSGGERLNGRYRLYNDCPQASFRLDASTDEDRAAIRRQHEH